MRLIDADALKEQILDWISEQVVSKYISHDACMATREGARVAFNLLNDAPTIDAVPVVRGEWIVDECDATDDVPSYSWIVFHCSECSMDYSLEEGQYGWYPYEKIPYKYCPNCGAKMESEGGT